APAEIASSSLHDALPIFICLFQEVSSTKWILIPKTTDSLLLNPADQFTRQNAIATGLVNCWNIHPIANAIYANRKNWKPITSLADRKSTRLNSSHVKISY